MLTLTRPLSYTNSFLLEPGLQLIPRRFDGDFLVVEYSSSPLIVIQIYVHKWVLTYYFGPGVTSSTVKLVPK